VDVTVLARGSRYEELRQQGILIEYPFNHRRSVTKVPVIERLEPQDVYDYILVIV
jgi:2-dehydropantoate 2-reductase